MSGRVYKIYPVYASVSIKRPCYYVSFAVIVRGYITNAQEKYKTEEEALNRVKELEAHQYKRVPAIIGGEVL